MGKPEKKPIDALVSNEMPPTELGGNEIPEEGLDSPGAERRRTSKTRGSKPSRH